MTSLLGGHVDYISGISSNGTPHKSHFCVQQNKNANMHGGMCAAFFEKAFSGC